MLTVRSGFNIHIISKELSELATNMVYPRAGRTFVSTKSCSFLLIAVRLSKSVHASAVKG